MLSRKLLSALCFLAAQAAAIRLETRDAKEVGSADITAAAFEVLQVFYPDCEDLKGAAPDDSLAFRSFSCASSVEESKSDCQKLLREAQALGYAI